MSYRAWYDAIMSYYSTDVVSIVWHNRSPEGVLQGSTFQASWFYNGNRWFLWNGNKKKNNGYIKDNIYAQLIIMK